LSEKQSWVTGTGISALMYFILSMVFPPHGRNRHFKEIDESAGEPRIDEIQRLRYGGEPFTPDYEKSKYQEESSVYVRPA
jgi:hypothetical protein